MHEVKAINNRIIYKYMYINNIAAPTANKAYTRNAC